MNGNEVPRTGVTMDGAHFGTNLGATAGSASLPAAGTGTDWRGSAHSPAARSRGVAPTGWRHVPPSITGRGGSEANHGSGPMVGVASSVLRSSR